MASANSTFTEMVSTTFRNHKRKLVDNVTKHNALLTLMKERGNIKTDSGCYEIVLPLSQAENSTYQRYSGLDTLNIGQSDVISAAKYDWQQVAIHVVSSGKEIKMNNSEQKLIDLVKSRVDVAMATAALPTYTQLKADMNNLWYQTNRGVDKPDLIVSSQDFYAVYEGGLQDNQRYMDAKMA